MTQIKLTLFLARFAGRGDGAAVNRHQPNDTMKTAKTAAETVTVQIASVMDDCGTNEIRTVEMTKAEQAEYNDGMARLAEMWG